MKKIRDGVGGEVTAEIFETWFPYMSYDDPELFLMDFIQSGNFEIVLLKNNNDDTFTMCKLTPEYAKNLLDEFCIMKKKT